jgi:formate dehydrogenase major subunit
MDALAGRSPFILHPDGSAWLYAPAGLVDGPLPTHYEPHESPFDNPLYSQRANPRRQQRKDADWDPYNPVDGEPGADVYPYVVTTYRLTEHHTAGGMTRSIPYLTELQPEMFCEVSPELAREVGLEHGGWATIYTARSAIEARVLVTNRIPPVTIQGRTTHQVGLPYHWGSRLLSSGDSANDLMHTVLDPNVHIQEAKAATCGVKAGRRPRGKALTDFVTELRERVLGAHVFLDSSGSCRGASSRADWARPRSSSTNSGSASPRGRRPGRMSPEYAMTSGMWTFGSSTRCERSFAESPVERPRVPQW